ncbi:MAG TPA: flagellar biosynthesis protein FlhF [Polyangiaceae bacterium]|nr:flagellar biosynthesis protein FlhF [Polyangiaceae bacterium]
MQYQSFRGADLREALGQVKQTLGPNALIETTRQVTNGQAGGLERSYVEVTAAAPAGIDWPFAAKAGIRTNANRPPAGAQGQKQGARGQSFQLLGGAHPDVERELSNLRAMVEELNANLPPRERALAMLHARGIEGALARELANGAARPAKKGREALQNWLVERVRERLDVAEDLLNVEGPMILACVGPTGVGKTTTLAKLAARARLDLGRSVAVVSLDSFRVGAAEQWQRYASLMGIPLHLVHEAAGFRRALRDTRADIVLVDTAGRSAHSVGSVLAESLRGITQVRVNVALVVPAWLRANDAERVVEGYSDPALTHVIVTKLDETQQIGGALHASMPRRLPLAYLCNGPRVPEDITDASRDSVLAALFPSDD